MRASRWLLAAVVAGAAACAPSAGGVAAAVNGVPITERSVEILVRSQAQAEPGQLLALSPERYREIDGIQQDTLGQLIQNEIVEQAAADLGIEVTEEEIDARFEELSAQFGGPEGLREEIARRGRTEADVRDQLAAVVRSERLNRHFSEQTAVSDEDVREAYEAQLDTRFRVAEVSHILVPTEEEADEIIALLEEGADFAELAGERSIDEFSAAAGGRLGANPRGTFVDPFDEAVWSAEEGEIVGPVATDFGFHVILVEDIRTTPLSEAEDELRSELGGQAAGEAFDAWFQEVLRAADVDVEARFGRWDPATGRVVARELVPAPTPPAAPPVDGGMDPGVSPAPTPDGGG